MIAYSLFEFATAPGTGALWMIRSLSRAGFGFVQPHLACIPFPKSKSDCLRVSMVRHPCDWLGHYFNSINSTTPVRTVGNIRVLPIADNPLMLLPTDSFFHFIESYLEQCPGIVGAMFECYDADSYIRAEDLPEAFYQLMDSLGISRSLYECRISIPDLYSGLPEWEPELRRKVCRAELKMLEDFDYHC